MPKSATLGHQLSQWFQGKEIEDWKGFILNLSEQEKTNVYNLLKDTKMIKPKEKAEASPGGSVVKKEQDEHKKKKKNTEEKAEAEPSCSVVKKEHHEHKKRKKNTEEKAEDNPHYSVVKKA